MNLEEIQKIISRISFNPSCVDMGWKFEAKQEGENFLIRTTFQRPDTHTSVIGTGYGRWMFLHKDIDERGVVMTAWLCAELIVKHELMEAFNYAGARILDPHKSLEELAFPHKIQL